MFECLSSVVGKEEEEGAGEVDRLVHAHAHHLARCIQLLLHRKKKLFDIPVPGRDVTY